MAVVLLALTLALSVGIQAPIPSALREAHTAYLVNDGAAQNMFDSLANTLRAWGRFELVDDIAKADVTISLSGLVAFKGWRMVVSDRKTHAQLWADRQKHHGRKKHAEVVLVENLRKQLES